MGKSDEAIDLGHRSHPWFVACQNFLVPTFAYLRSGVLKDCAGRSKRPSFVAATRVAPGIEVMRAAFFGHAFSSHRHDTYGIGLTTLGVQAFGYRGEMQWSACGHAFVLHPDELHDGRAGDERGFGYRIAYIEPSLVLA